MTKNPSRNPQNAFRAIEEEGGLVVIPDKSEVKVLNPVASKIYEMLDGSNSVDDIVKAVITDFDVSEEIARKDVNTFLEELEAEGMLGGDAAGSE